MPHAEGLLDLDRHAREEIAERVLQGEAHHHGADGGSREQLLAHQHRRDDEEQPDDGDVLHDGGEAIGGAAVAPRVDQQRDDEVDEGEDEDQPGQGRDERSTSP